MSTVYSGGEAWGEGRSQADPGYHFYLHFCIRPLQHGVFQTLTVIPGAELSRAELALQQLARRQGVDSLVRASACSFLFCQGAGFSVTVSQITILYLSVLLTQGAFPCVSRVFLSFYDDC